MSSNPFPPRCAENFHHERPLAEGAFGSVHLATQIRLKRLVAVKLLHREELREEDSVRRFLGEARVTAALSHPSIVTLIDHDVEDGVPWIAYEYLPGRTLEVVLAQGAQPWPIVARIGAQVASALHEAHAHGILHRDVKPSNIMEASDSVWKITDFGIAQWTGAARVKTRTGEVVGTFAYIAPEQIRGAPASPQSDVFSLGVALHELATGRHPYEGHVLRLLARTAELPPPSEALASIPPAFDAAIARAVARDPAARYATAAEMAAAFEALPAGAVGEGPRGPRTTRKTRPPSRATTPTVRSGERRRAVPALVLALAVSAGALALLTRPAARPEPAASPAAAPSARPAHAISTALHATAGRELVRLGERGVSRRPEDQRLNALLLDSLGDMAKVRPLAHRIAVETRADVQGYERLDRAIRAELGDERPALFEDGRLVERVTHSIAADTFRLSRLEQIEGIARRVTASGGGILAEDFVMQFGNIAMERRCLQPARRYLEVLPHYVPLLAARGTDDDANGFVNHLRDFATWTSAMGWQANARAEWTRHAAAFRAHVERITDPPAAPLAAATLAALEYVWAGRPQSRARADALMQTLPRLRAARPDWASAVGNLQAVPR